MLRIYACVVAAVLGVIAIAAAVRISSAGLGVSVLYLSSAVIFAYAGFSRKNSTIIRSVVAAMGLFFLLTGLLVALTMSVLGFPFQGKGWEVGLVHAAFGGLTMACAVLLPCDDESDSRQSGHSDAALIALHFTEARTRRVLRSTHAPHRLSQPVLRITRHTAPFRGSAIVPTISFFLSRALKRPVPLYTRASLRLDCS